MLNAVVHLSVVSSVADQFRLELSVVTKIARKSLNAADKTE